MPSPRGLFVVKAPMLCETFMNYFAKQAYLRYTSSSGPCAFLRRASAGRSAVAVFALELEKVGKAMLATRR